MDTWGMSIDPEHNIANTDNVIFLLTILKYWRITDAQIDTYNYTKTLDLSLLVQDVNKIPIHSCF